MSKRRVALAGVGLAAGLFLAKGWAALATNSTALKSDALNSLFDVFAYAIVHASVVIHERAPDTDHPFGHRRAEPLAGLVLAVLAAVLGSAVIRDAVSDLMHHGPLRPVPGAIAVAVAAIATKLALAYGAMAQYRRTRSPAMLAAATDSRNDALASGLALFGLVSGPRLDAAAGVAIGAWIIISGVRIGLMNLGYLMGRAPSEEFLRAIRDEALAEPGVLGTNDLRAHYVGDVIHLEIHVEVDAAMPLEAAHDLGLAVRRRLESLPRVHRVFVHLDPVPAGPSPDPQE